MNPTQKIDNQYHDDMGHQRQSASWLAPLGFNRSTANNAHNQVQTKKQTNLRNYNFKKIGTFNCQGLLSPTKQMMLANDFFDYKMKALMIQETHIKGHGIIDIKSSKGKTARLYYSGHKSKSEKGVGILVEPNTECEYFPVSDRIIMLKIKNEDVCINLISSYGPTSEKTANQPEATTQFYNNLSSIISKTKNKEALIIGGDFNAKVKELGPNQLKAVGKYAKNEINKNGEFLLEFAELQQLQITNTLFKHKPAHISTWTCPQRRQDVTDANSGTPRRNPYRNQIDFVLTRKGNNMQVIDSRSYGGFSCNSDHKPVIAKIKIGWKQNRKLSSKCKKINYEVLNQNLNKRQQYQNCLREKLTKLEISTNNQEEWDNIVKCTQESAIEIAGYKNKRINFVEDQKIKDLSNEQKELLEKINATNSLSTKEIMKKQRNKILNTIHKEIEQRKNKEINLCMEPIENMPDQPNRTYTAVKKLKRMKPKTHLIIKTENGLTANELKQTEMISEYFKKQFLKGADGMPSFNPTPMQIPFTAEELKKAATRLKNNTSPGVDLTTSEEIKYGPQELFERIAKLLNKIAATGNAPKELTRGIITPLQKPGKPKGPISNLRPITLLSILRKLLAICLCERTNTRIDSQIPIEQAAYRKGRSTTEHVFATKLAIERTVSAKNEKLHLLLLDMSKAFDTIQRKTLILELQKILQPDEIHLFSKLLNVELAVKCGKTKGEFFETDTGGPQGDCSSAKNFTFYLAQTMQDDEVTTSPPDNENEISLEQLYADDISELSSNLIEIQTKLEKLPEILAKNGLIVNDDKTEQYEISRTSETWKKCKLLGTLLDTSEDIKRRKGLAIDAAKTLKHIFNNKKVWTSTKARAFDTYISSVFLYNSCTWTLTATQENQTDSFQRKMLRINVLNVTWPKKVSNENVYKLTKVKPWSIKIRKQKATWFGHLIRMHPDTPARKALKFAKQEYQRPQGKPKTTWIKSYEKILMEDMKLTWSEAEEKALDRKIWRHFTYQTYY